MHLFELRFISLSLLLGLGCASEPASAPSSPSSSFEHEARSPAASLVASTPERASMCVVGGGFEWVERGEGRGIVKVFYPQDSRLGYRSELFVHDYEVEFRGGRTASEPDALDELMPEAVVEAIILASEGVEEPWYIAEDFSSCPPYRKGA